VLNLLADNEFGDTRGGALAGPTGLVIILLLVIGTILLIRNMNQRLRRLPETFEQPAEKPESKQESSQAGEDGEPTPPMA
jgi:hypothetical protein